MSILARHRYIISRLQEGFSFKDEEEVEQLILLPGVIDSIDYFFTTEGPLKISFALEKVSVPVIDESSRQQYVPSKKFRVDFDTMAHHSDTVVYFMKTKKGRVDPAKINDGALSFGVMRAPLESLEVLLRCVYRPLIQDMGDPLWGEASTEQRSEFLMSIDTFAHSLQENVRSLSKGLELRKPDERIEHLGNGAATNPALVTHAMNILQEWCNSITRYLDDSDRSRWENADSGPETELNYWRSRTQRLTSITEQLKNRSIRAVISLLTTVVRKADNDNLVDVQRASTLLAQWREIDVHITEAANEAKDNVKYLSTLERFFDILDSKNPTMIIDALPALMNALKMIHTIARYFSTTERMTKLFMKITNSMIASCRLAINGKETPDKLWDRHLPTSLEVIEKCLQLNEDYQEQYRLTKERLMTMPKGKQFDFSETQIFGKFDLFCRRLIKLMDMLSTMQQFRTLSHQKFEGIEPLLVTFEDAVRSFRAKGHDLLDFHNNRFDREYVDFNQQLIDIEVSLQAFINRSFENISSIEQSLALLKKYQTILHRENLRSDLDSKLTVIFHNYGIELARVEQIYEKSKQNPPIGRNLPPVAGNIAWARHLLKKIEDPMLKFQGHPTILQSKESKKIIKTYNKVAKTLVAFEYLWYEAWCTSLDAACAGLQATLIIRHPSTAKLYVNFDQDLFQLIRESKCLAKLDIDIPENAKLVLLQEDKFKHYYDDLKFILSEYERITNRIIPVTQKLLEPHLKTLDLKIRPGMITLTWTSLNIDSYKDQIHQGLAKLEDLVTKINDIVENRIHKNLKLIGRSNLVNLPNDVSVALDEFVSMQETAVKQTTNFLTSKNLEVELAVQDLFTLLNSYPIDSSIDPVQQSYLDTVQKHFNSLTYQALLNCTRNSLELIKKRTCNRAGAVKFTQKPFFEVDVQLSVPSVRLNPSLDDIQKAINRSAVAVISCSKRMFQWGQGQIPEKERLLFFDILGQDLELIKTVLLLTGAMYGTRNQVNEYLTLFRKYDWLWKEDKENEYKAFMSRGPSISDFEEELKKFMSVEEEIEKIAPIHVIGALRLNTANLKLQLRNESRQWKVLYSNKVHIQAKESMYNLYEYMRVTTNKLNLDVQSLDSLRYVMNVLKEIRERESSIEMEITPIVDMYQMLEHYLPGGVVDKEEIEQKANIRTTWRKLVDYAEVVTDNLSSIQGVYKKELIWNIREFTVDIRALRKDFEENGPMLPDTSSAIGVEKLRKYKEELMVRERKMDMYRAGEELFALRPTRFNELVKTRKEIALLDQLYSLFSDVQLSTTQFNTIVWTDVVLQLDLMSEAIAAYDARCKKLPKRLREWPAYDEVRTRISNYLILIPLLQEMSKPSIKGRHWDEIRIATGMKTVPSEEEEFRLAVIINSDIFSHKEEIEEICDSADKQLQIEKKLLDLKEQWQTAMFEFNIWKTRDIPVLKAFGSVIEELEEAQLQLQTLLSMRHVTPFKDEVQKFLAQLSDTSDTLEMWVKVQMLWTSLESVFLGGDIAKQMPIEAKKFAKLNKDWEKLMHRASETKLVVQCCGNDLLKNTLPVLYSELEKCQKSLEGYLEQKRSKFPRFYFVSNPVLLVILSQGSDPMQMQPYYEKVFDSIDRVVHGKNENRSQIIQFQSNLGTTKETVSMNRPVKAQGNIEDWLGELEVEMQRSLKYLCERAATECSTLPLRQFVNASCGQFALLGLQLNWTSQCAEALTKVKANKQAISENTRMQLQILQDLSGWCLEDLGNRMMRIKIETLVTIQVHQRDVFVDIAKLFKERKIQDSNDFEWLKQTRFYWRPNAFDRHGAAACVISICDVDYKYAYEYLGCKERLVITPLTDRCFITLSQAMGMCLGGAPAGPAGTGKTETVKDLGRSIGVFVVVTNCTDQQRFTDLARIFKGLCQAGLWGCFDEFNRIELPVLSVVAQQVLAITNAKRVGATTFTFPGDTGDIHLNRQVGYFITMNPGYQGRQELPENLKALFRGVSMMVPDREIIIKVKLCSVGYQNFPELARKFTVLYRLCEQQLSKQKHYDFGLRNILSVLRTAGQTKRNKPTDPEEVLLMSTLRDMNLSKLVAQDVPLFLSLISDLFPALGIPMGSPHPELKSALGTVVESEGLIPHPTWMTKIVQLYETNLVRHGIMMVGPTGTGKTKIISCLALAMQAMTGVIHKTARMNPKAIRAEEMFGETDKLSGEWLDGVFATMWAKYNDRNRKDNHWIVCDGPVDALWIENLNSVLDDNKILTLANGDRIPMTDNVKLMFEVEDLRNASPATVSRAGIIYVSESDLDWEPVLRSWLKGKAPIMATLFGNCFKKYVGGCEGPKSYGHLFHFMQKNCKPVLSCSRVGMIEGCCSLLDGLLEYCDLSNNQEILTIEVERLFFYSITWSVGGILEAEDRIKFTNYISIVSQQHGSRSFPAINAGDTIFEYRVNTDSCDWEKWIAPIWEYPSHLDEPDFSNMLVPTVETTRASFLLRLLHTREKGSILTGGSGTAKTSAAILFLDTLPNDSMRVKKICFSSATSPANFQTSVEAELDKRGGKSYGPPGGKQMTLFIDDMSMPEKNEWGDQPTLELVRQLVETSTFCFLEKDKRGDWKSIEDLKFIGAMAHPSGGRNDIPNRLKRHFFIFNIIIPSLNAINEIYGQMLRGRFANTSSYFFHLVSILPSISVNLWSWMRTKMLPSPSKFHYVFNLRDLSRVFQGVLRTPKTSIREPKLLVQLWRHECERVFADKLTTDEDKLQFMLQLNECTQELVKPTVVNPVPDHHKPKGKSQGKKNLKRNVVEDVATSNETSVVYDELLVPTFFVDFLRDDELDEEGNVVCEAPKVYEFGGSIDSLRLRVKEFLNRYNEAQPTKAMNLVLFDDALIHMMRISRCLGMPKGSMLLVGVGGSGKQSLTRLASFCAGYQTYQIVVSKTYNLNSFLDDLRLLYKQCGQTGQKVTFIFTETEIKDESFLEIINSILTTGEVANLFPKDELAIMASELRSVAMRTVADFVDSPDNLVKFFIDRVRSNLHIILCMSPLSAKFPERARRFPGIVAGCTIDWFLPWPKEALIAVSEGYIQTVNLSCTQEIRKELIVHMGMVHKLVSDSSDEYFQKTRRHVYQTPKSFMSFLSDYAILYSQKYNDVMKKASRVEIGLEKLNSGAKDVEKMKVILAEEEVKLRLAEESTNVMLTKLEKSSMEAKREADIVMKKKEACELDAERISGEKADAEDDLARAQPFLDEAERAVGSIKPNDLNELKKLGKPSDVIKLIFDCVGLLKMEKLVRVEPAEVTLGVGKDKKTFLFIKDSYKIVQTGMLSDARFLQTIFQFSKVEKDFINDETIELMAPYLALEGFNPAVARNASRAAEGLCIWCRAMSDYHEASKIVKPKLEALRMAEERLRDAERELSKAESRLRQCQDVLAKFQSEFDQEIAHKRAIEENAVNTRKRMEQATALINGLGGERQRWKEDKDEFINIKNRLVGDVALACAFVAYCGPFNQDFREYLIQQRLSVDIKERKIPLSSNLDLTNFLADIGTIGDWNLEGLPTDPLSIQNGILVTRSSRYPLLIDPQGQALKWICNHEENRMPPFGLTSFANAKFRDHLEHCLAEGKACLISGVEEELDPFIIPVLEKQIIVRAKSKYISISGKMCDYSDDFRLYMITRLPSPHFSPEDQSRCTIVDFTVTQKGLEEQLLGRVIQKEQRSLEEQLTNVLEEVTMNTKALLSLDKMLLERLSENTGNLLDDEDLITVLADTKSKSMEVKDKLIAAAEMRRTINEKREQYRPVATRGSVLYFAVVDMSHVNCMYQTSLDQFQKLFDKSMDVAERATIPLRRVNHIIEAMTFICYRYMNRGFYEKDKTSFKLILTFKILLTANKLDPRNVSLFLRGGGTMDPSHIPVKPFPWMSDDAWLNLVQLSTSNNQFKSLPEDIERYDSAWISWYNENEPEKFQIPNMEAKFAHEEDVSANFLRLLLVRCLREDRTLLAVNDFIRKTESVDLNGMRVPVMGAKYIEPLTDTVDSVLKEMEATTPVIYLLSAGADPTDSIETLARRKRRGIECVSMGEGQDIVAQRAFTTAVANGSWLLLQNCHLGLAFINSLEDMLLKLRSPDSNCNPDFRLFITTEPHPAFSIGLLQMSTKVTNEPPKGLKAGLQRSYTVIVDQDRIDRIESQVWRSLTFAICFLHSVVQERRKFGPLGWSVPYEFNDGDLNATLTFLEKHLEQSGGLSWSTLQYMVAEVQYGGRITDDLDRRLFGGYTEAWLSTSTLSHGFNFNPDRPINRMPDNFTYAIPDFLEIDDYMQYIQRFPEVDPPEVLGLHPNADLTFRFKEVHQLLDTIVETQPKQSGAITGGRTREEVVLAKCQDLIGLVPTNYVEDEYQERLAWLGGFEIPLNIFLFQEVQRMQAAIDKVRSTLEIVLQAIRGDVVVTAEIIESINSFYDARVPKTWLYSAAGDELSWLAPNLGVWYGGLLQRDEQYRTWLAMGRPVSYWLAGFFNPQGFLTAVQQEITRAHKADNWALDSMVLHSEVTDLESIENVRFPPKEGVYIHGLSMDGAAWNSKESTIAESPPKKLFALLPLMLVTAVTKSSKKLLSGDHGPYGGYDCPVYKYPARTDRYLVFSVLLPSRDHRPLHWVLRGVALLCTTS